MDITLLFADSISEAYVKRLQTFVDNIIAWGVTENRPPLIWFPGMTQEKYEEIQGLRRAFVRQN